MIKRNTIQCALVLEAVRSLRCHATADEVYDFLAREHPTISRGTVYRNLQRLCESGEIRKCEIPEGADRYDHCLTSHYHIRCAQCGRVSDVDMPYMEHLESAVRDAHGYALTGHDIMFRGVCPECGRNNHSGATPDERREGETLQ